MISFFDDALKDPGAAIVECWKSTRKATKRYTTLLVDKDCLEQRDMLLLLLLLTLLMMMVLFL